MKAGQDQLDVRDRSESHTTKTFIHDDLSDLPTNNSFGALSDDMFESEENVGNGLNVLDSDGEEIDEHMFMYDKKRSTTDEQKEASTSSADSPHV